MDNEIIFRSFIFVNGTTNHFYEDVSKSSIFHVRNEALSSRVKKKHQQRPRLVFDTSHEQICHFSNTYGTRPHIGWDIHNNRCDFPRKIKPHNSAQCELLENRIHTKRGSRRIRSMHIDIIHLN